MFGFDQRQIGAGRWLIKRILGINRGRASAGGSCRGGIGLLRRRREAREIGQLQGQVINLFRSFFAGLAFLIARFDAGFNFLFFLQPVLLVERDGFVGLLFLEGFDVLAQVSKILVAGDALGGSLFQLWDVGLNHVELVVLCTLDFVILQSVIERTLADVLG